MAELVREGYGYLGTYLKDDKYPWRSGTSTLLVRHFKITRGPKTGKLYLYVKTEAWEFADDDEMIAGIDERGAFELPPEADGNPRFVPEGWRV